VLGLAFKPGTGRLRESASLKIVSSLVRDGAKVIAHDPIATDHFRRALGAVANQVEFVAAWEPHVREAEGVIIATRWPDYATLVNMDLPVKFSSTHGGCSRPTSNGARYLTIGRRSPREVPPTEVEGCFVVEPAPRGDDRGFFARIFDAETFARRGWPISSSS